MIKVKAGVLLFLGCDLHKGKYGLQCHQLAVQSLKVKL